MSSSENASTLRREIAKHLPELHEGLERINSAGTRAELDTMVDLVFSSLPQVSFWVVEQVKQVHESQRIGWDDLGNWCDVARLRSAAAHGNCLVGNDGRSYRGVLIEAQGSCVVAPLGLSDVVVNDVSAQDQAQDMRRLAEQVRRLNSRIPTRL